MFELQQTQPCKKHSADICPVTANPLQFGHNVLKELYLTHSFFHIDVNLLKLKLRLCTVILFKIEFTEAQRLKIQKQNKVTYIYIAWTISNHVVIIYLIVLACITWVLHHLDNNNN